MIVHSHVARLIAIWLVLTAVAEWLVLGVMPVPGPMHADAGVGEHYTMKMLFVLGAPIFVFVYTFLIYSVIVFRARHDDDKSTGEELVYARGSRRALFWWSALSLVTVFFLAAWGTFTLPEVTRAAGPNPLVVQVIAQQWQFTYRYPSYGGVESTQLVLPTNRPIRLSITSLDVVHDFWVYTLDVKEDAVPGVTNYANLKVDDPGTYHLVCDELCGIWHGYMRGWVYALPATQFTHWVTSPVRTTLPAHIAGTQLPPYNEVYYPDPQSYPSPPQSSAQ
jgi:cytochrome c oxidase subunit II